jgi:hypothetical protein
MLIGTGLMRELEAGALGIRQFDDLLYGPKQHRVVEVLK